MLSQYEPWDLYFQHPYKNYHLFGEAKKTTTGKTISILCVKFTGLKNNWLDSFRYFPVAKVNVAFNDTTDDSHLNKYFQSIGEDFISLFTNEFTDCPLPVEDLEHLSYRYDIWLFMRNFMMKIYSESFHELGVNKQTTIHYLNLLAFGIKDYQQIIAKLENSKPLTVRDRIAYARRYKWIPTVGVGERSAMLNKVVEK
jgi:hypothetical protein